MKTKTLAKPFAEHNNYIPVHKLVFDVIMPSLSNSGWKCLCFALRKTKGWGKESDPISYSQFKLGTGIKSNTTICKALMELRGYVKLDKEWIRDFDLPDYLLAYESASPEIPLTYALNHQVEIELPKSARQWEQETMFD